MKGEIRYKVEWKAVGFPMLRAGEGGMEERGSEDLIPANILIFLCQRLSVLLSFGT
jgi:hypothetical protein